MIARLMELLYPSRARCLACGDVSGQSQPWLCDACMAGLADRHCGRFSAEGLEGAWAAYDYHGPAGAFVRQLKYNGLTALAGTMAEQMLEGLIALDVPKDALIVPVPMHASRLRRRGFNQSALLASALAERGAPTCVEALTRLRDTPQQMKLSAQERRTNLQDAFYADESVRGRTVLLLDDVYTTGCTARECAKALREAGAEQVMFIGFTREPLKGA